MLARIRDIGLGESALSKVRDLFALSSDYDKTDKATQVFFATVQNLLIYAVTQKTLPNSSPPAQSPADPHFRPVGLEGRQGAQDGHRGGQELPDRGRDRHP